MVYKSQSSVTIFSLSISKTTSNSCYINLGLTGPDGVQVTIISYNIYQTLKLLVCLTHVALMSDSEGNSFVFPGRSRGKHQDSRENKTNWFPERPDIKGFVIILDFHFNSNERITRANQNSRLSSYKNTNLILKTNEWITYKVLSLFYLHLLPPLAVVSLLE